MHINLRILNRLANSHISDDAYPMHEAAFMVDELVCDRGWQLHDAIAYASQRTGVSCADIERTLEGM